MKITSTVYQPFSQYSAAPFHSSPGCNSRMEKFISKTRNQNGTFLQAINNQSINTTLSPPTIAKRSFFVPGNRFWEQKQAEGEQNQPITILTYYPINLQQSLSCTLKTTDLQNGL